MNLICFQCGAKRMTPYTGARHDEMPRIVTGEGWIYAKVDGKPRCFCTMECRREAGQVQH
jgi:hypothetical protein